MREVFGAGAGRIVWWGGVVPSQCDRCSARLSTVFVDCKSTVGAGAAFVLAVLVKWLCRRSRRCVGCFSGVMGGLCRSFETGRVVLEVATDPLFGCERGGPGIDVFGRPSAAPGPRLSLWVAGRPATVVLALPLSFFAAAGRLAVAGGLVDGMPDSFFAEGRFTHGSNFVRQHGC